MIKELINEKISDLSDDYQNKRYGLLVAKILGYIIAISCTLVFIYWVCRLIYYYLEYIVCAIGLVISFWAVFRGFFPKQPKQIAPMKTPVHNAFALENTYKNLRAGLCCIVREVGDILSVRKPSTESQLSSNNRHYYFKGNVPVYSFVLVKISTEMDANTILGILQENITNKLNNAEFKGFPQPTFPYNGLSYPAVMVDNVLDHGNTWEVDLVFVNAQYCANLERMSCMESCGDTETYYDKDF